MNLIPSLRPIFTSQSLTIYVVRNFDSKKEKTRKFISITRKNVKNVHKNFVLFSREKLQLEEGCRFAGIIKNVFSVDQQHSYANFGEFPSNRRGGKMSKFRAYTTSTLIRRDDSCIISTYDGTV